LSARYGERLAIVAEGAVSHFDAGPVHVLTTSSLRWVEQEYGPTGGDARRYRPNIVLETDGVALVEEGWAAASLSIGSCVLEVSRAVERCVMPTFRQDGLPRAQGLLRFLTERNDTMLGVYANVTSPGVVSVGDLVTFTQ
jgi:MOSC domain-containing protein